MGVSPAQLLALSLLALAALGAGQLAEEFWLPLAHMTFRVVEWLLGWFYSTVVARPSDLVLGTDSFTVQVAPTCSGYEGMGLVAVFVGAFIWWFRRELRFPQSILLLVIGVLAVWLANAVRIAALIAIGASVSPSIALGGFHSQAGWIAFNLVALGVIAVGWSSPFFAKNAARSDSTTHRAEYPAAPYWRHF